MLSKPKTQNLRPNELFSLKPNYQNEKFKHWTENDRVLCCLTDSLMMLALDKTKLVYKSGVTDLKEILPMDNILQSDPIQNAALSNKNDILALIFKSLKIIFVEISRLSTEQMFGEQMTRFSIALCLDRLGPFEWSRGSFFHVCRSEVFKVDFSKFHELKKSSEEKSEILPISAYGPPNIVWKKFYDFKDPIVDFSASRVHQLFYFLGKRSLIKIVNHMGTLLHRKSLFSNPDRSLPLPMPSIIVPGPLADVVRLKALICVPRRDIPKLDPNRDYDISFRDFIFVMRLNGVAEVYKISHLKVSGSPQPVFSHQLMGPPGDFGKLRFVVDPQQSFFAVRCGLARKTFVYKITKHFSRYNKFPHDKSKIRYFLN